MNGATSAAVGWDLLGTGYRLRFVLAEDTQDLFGHLYAVRGLERFLGNWLIKIDGTIEDYALNKC